MSQPEENIEPADAIGGASKPKRSVLRGLIFIGGNLIVPILMAFAIVWAYNWLIETAPEAERGARKRLPRLAEFVEVAIADHDVKITAYGSVMPARMVDLKPRVDGAIDAIFEGFEPGGIFKKDAPVVWIDQARYRLAKDIAAQELVRAGEDINALQGQVDEAKASLSIELGRCEVAAQEYQLMGIKVENKEKLDRLLRKPQLAQAQSALQSAKARVAVAEASKSVAKTRLDAANLNSDRTTVRAPFNATVMQRLAEVGDHAMTSSSLARICSTDTAWIEVSVPSGSLSWIEIPEVKAGGKQDGDSARGEESKHTSRVSVFHDHVWGKGVMREAHIIRLLPGRSQTGRQARLLLALDDPFCLNDKTGNQPKLLLNSFVRVVITGRKINSVVKLRRDALHDGKIVWVAGKDDKLEIREVEPIWSSKEHVFISSDQLKSGERLIVSVIPTPVPGLALRPRLKRDSETNEMKN
ncbi:MAG: multidrug efflux pump subunit AcrA (membrane-fusion protein) [Planctomycetota bacterium]|jgi:multidrug efflux pump subunit AcrA (membrane-fusion protein)